MSLGSTTRRNAYTGNGTTNTYSYTFRIFSDDALRVAVTNGTTYTILTPMTDYTVSGAGNAGGGIVTLTSVGQAWIDGSGFLATSWTLSIRGAVPLTQGTSIRNQGAYYAALHEDAFDRLTMMAQQQQDAIDRSVKLPETLTFSDFNPVLPVGIKGTIGRVPSTNSSGNGWDDPANWPTVNSISGAQGSATAAAASAAAAASSASSASSSAASATGSATSAAASATAAATSAASAVAASTQRYNSDTVWDGSTTSKSVDVSATISDARLAVWQLCDNVNNYVRVFCKIETTQTMVTITVEEALAAGNYKLVGIY